MTADASKLFWPNNYGCYGTTNIESTSSVFNIKKLLTHVQIFINNNVNSLTFLLKKKCYTTPNMVPILNISLFSRDNVVKNIPENVLYPRYFSIGIIICYKNQLKN